MCIDYSHPDARDGGGRSGTRVEAALAPTPRRQAGQACSTAGFDVCANAVCATNAAGTTTCQAPSTLRAASCRAAPVFAITRGTTVNVTGETGASSAFELPADCAPNSPTGRPEAVVILEIGGDLARLTVTTDTPATTFDTVVTVLPACAAPMTDALASADDGPASVASTVELQALARGTYAVVVDSFRPEGDRFGLRITAEQPLERSGASGPRDEDRYMVPAP